MLLNDLNNLKGLFEHIADCAHDAANGAAEWKPRKRMFGPLGAKGLKSKLRYIRDKAKAGQEACDSIKEETKDDDVFIPAKPECGIKQGYYNHTKLVGLLRKHKNNPEAIQYIADMME